MNPTDPFTRPVVYTVPGMDSVRVQADLTFKGADGADLKMDVYAPRSAEARSPAALFVHGGPVPNGSNPKGWGVYRSYGRIAGASGLVGVTFNHRYHAPPDVATAEGDVRAAIEHIRSNAESLEVDQDRLAVCVYSGGGPLVSWLLREGPSYLKALVAYYAVLDVQQLPGGVPAGTSQEVLRRFSPVAQLGESKGKLPRLLVARAGLDNPWLNGTVDRFVAAALSVNASIDVMNHPTGQHGFDILDDDDRSREIIARTIDFLVKSLAAIQ